MSKILTVIEPFFTMEVGDTFELTKDGNSYVSACNVGHDEIDSDNNHISSNYSASFTISKDYAKLLIEEGYLEESSAEEKKHSSFVNVFDEIAKLIEKYGDELDNLDNDYKDQPACMKVEKETVLRNIIKVLMHLNSLKK
jgi:hypothetical protein